MIKYTFFFDEGSIASIVEKEEEDLRIQEGLDTEGLLELPGEKFDLYINMALVKCTAREVVNATPAPNEELPVQNQEGGPH